MRMTRKKVFVALGAAISVGAIATAGFAFWTTSGSGTGTGSTAAGTADELTISSSPAFTDFYPGDAPQTFTVNVQNDSSQTATVSSVKAYVTTAAAGCTGADFLINGSAAPSTAGSAVALAWTAADLASGANADTAGTDTIQFNNTVNNQDVCKDVAVTVHYVAS